MRERTKKEIMVGENTTKATKETKGIKGERQRDYHWSPITLLSTLDHEHAIE